MPFTDQDIYEAVRDKIPTVSSYVNSHGGDIKLLGSKDGTVYIELMGTCKSCAMSVMTTKMVVQKELRLLIHPTLNIVNVDGAPENKLPDEFYTEDEIYNPIVKEKKIGIIKKVTSFFMSKILLKVN